MNFNKMIVYDKKSKLLIKKLSEKKTFKINKIDENVDTYDHLIDKNGYLNFLHRKKKIEINSICMYDTLEELYIKKKIDYPDSRSNVQIQYLIKNIFKGKKIIPLKNLYLLFTHFLPFDDSYRLINILKNKNIYKDNQIIEIIKNIYIKRKKNTNYSSGTKCSTKEFTSQYISSYIKRNLSKTLLNYDSKKISYIDLCCGNGTKTIQIANQLKIPMNNVYGTDIMEWGPYKSKKKFPFHFKYIENNKLHYEDNSFELITCFLSLHHIQKLSNFLKEIHRVLKPNGIFVFIEHEPYDDLDKIIIDFQHALFSYLYDNNKDYLKNPVYSRYFNFMEWDYIMDKHKFEFVASRTITESIRKDTRYDIQFFGIYKKTNIQKYSY
jgi:ubiquinone/menaquinone biosynthesis C-methylase UbiE